MVIILAIVLGAFFNSVMDALENENYFESIFKAWDQKFWYKRESWKHTKKILGYRFDGWHLSKTLMIVVLFVGVWWQVLILKEPVVQTGSVWLDLVISVFLSGATWDLSFSFFYHWIFRVK
jgi:hypothetical protein